MRRSSYDADRLAVLEPYAEDFLAEAGVSFADSLGSARFGGNRSDWMFGSRSGESMFGFGGNANDPDRVKT